MRHADGSDTRSAAIRRERCCVSVATFSIIITLMTASFVRQYKRKTHFFRDVHRSYYVMAERVSVAKMSEEIQNKDNVQEVSRNF